MSPGFVGVGGPVGSGVPGVGLVVGSGVDSVPGGGVVGVTVTVTVFDGVGTTGGGSSGGESLNSHQASTRDSAAIASIAASAYQIAAHDGGRSAVGHGNGQIRNRPGRRLPSQ